MVAVAGWYAKGWMNRVIYDGPAGGYQRWGSRLEMALYAGAFLVLAACTAWQVEHWTDARQPRFRFSMRAMFAGVTILAIVFRLAPAPGVPVNLADAVLKFPIFFGLFACGATLLRWLDRVAKRWSQPEDDGRQLDS